MENPYFHTSLCHLQLGKSSYYISHRFYPCKIFVLEDANEYRVRSTKTLLRNKKISNFLLFEAWVTFWVEDTKNNIELTFFIVHLR